MMPDLIGVLRDVLVLAYMLVLRIGVPIILTWLLGMWLQKVLRESDAAALRQAQPTLPDSLDVSGAHCWEIKNCAAAARSSCAAAQHPELPCWLALQINGAGLKEACFTCPLFVTGPAVPRVVPVPTGRATRPFTSRRQS